MPSIGSLLQIARSGLSTQQLAMEVAAHNIANAATDGYSRQRVTFTGNPTVRTVQGVFGSGVHISTIGHVRDELLDRAFYRGLGTATESEARASVLGRIEGLFGEPSETGLGAAMDQFYSGWSSLASNPNSTVSRSALRQQATALIEKFHSLVANIDQVRQDVETRLTVAVDRVTALSADIARLNTAIVAAESDGKTAGDLRDTRGRALTELAGLIPIDVIERANGSVGVNSAGLGIIDGGYSLKLEVKTVSGTVGITVAGSSSLLPQTGATIGGLLYCDTARQGHPISLDDHG